MGDAEKHGGQLATEKFSARMIPWSAVSRSQIQYEAGTAIFIHFMMSFFGNVQRAALIFAKVGDERTSS